nr:hypothetical protein HmN_000710400 [Hymenolepis microstoma]
MDELPLRLFPNEVRITHEAAFSILTENLGSSKLSMSTVDTVGAKCVAGIATDPRAELSLPTLAKMETNEDHF